MTSRLLKASSAARLKRIMVFGTFDVVHKGHENFFRQARQLSRRPVLIVSVARDQNVKRVKGKRPQHAELQRLRQVKQNRLVDRAVLGGLHDHIPHIVQQKPDIIALGYDQKDYIKGLRRDLKKRNLLVKIVRLRPYRPEKYKTSLILKK